LKCPDVDPVRTAAYVSCMAEPNQATHGVLGSLTSQECKALYRRAYALSGHASDAWDLVQDTLERAMNHLPAAISREGLNGWLHVTLRNLFVDRARTARRYPHVPLPEDLTAGGAPDQCALAAWRAIEEVELLAAVRRLDPRLRQVYLLHAHQRLPLKVIAATLGVPPATAGTRLFRARRQIRRALLSNARRTPLSGPVVTVGSTFSVA
jgi:RNA polymerase sigma-70 factor, ECF subfamily